MQMKEKRIRWRLRDGCAFTSCQSVDGLNRSTLVECTCGVWSKTRLIGCPRLQSQREVRNTNFISTKPGIGNLAHPCRRMKCLPVLLFADALDQHLGRPPTGSAPCGSSMAWLAPKAKPPPMLRSPAAQLPADPPPNALSPHCQSKVPMPLSTS